MSFGVILSIIGGLGLFLYGMRLMSEGLQKAAGAKMRNVLETLTKNKIRGLLAGALFTAVIQSSSTATVMVVSFVNAKLMTLAEAAGVIMGANIGTTITSVLISFKLDTAAPIFVMCGVLMVMFAKKQVFKEYGDVVLGFGILFTGLGTMSGGMNALKESAAVMNALGSLSNPFLAFIIGLSVTALIQSSSATVGVIQVAAFSGMLDLRIILFMLLGCNIGACASAVISSFGAKKDAKRAALIHLLINVIISCTMFIVFLFISDKVADFFISISGANPMRQVSNAHVILRIIEIFIMFPFTGLVTKLTYKLVPGEDKVDENKFGLRFITQNRMAASAMVPNIVMEIRRMGEMAIGNVSDAMNAIINRDSKKIGKIMETEKYIDYLDTEITKALVAANQASLPIGDKELIGGLFHAVNDIERIGDHAENMAEAAQLRIRNNLSFTNRALKELRDMTEAVEMNFKFALNMFVDKNEEHMRDLLEVEDLVDDMEVKYNASHLKRLANGKCTSEAGIIFTDTISALERISDHCTNIAFAIYAPGEEKYIMVDDGDIYDNSDDELDESFKSRVKQMKEQARNEEIRKIRIEKGGNIESGLTNSPAAELSEESKRLDNEQSKVQNDSDSEQPKALNDSDSE